MAWPGSRGWPRQMAQDSAVATHGPTTENSRLRAVDVSFANFACSAAARAIGGTGGVPRNGARGRESIHCATSFSLTLLLKLPQRYPHSRLRAVIRRDTCS